MEDILSSPKLDVTIDEILIILSRQDSVEKAELIGKLFRLLLARKITEKYFFETCSIIERLIIDDLKILSFYKSQFVNPGFPATLGSGNSTYYHNSEYIQRLKGMGIILSSFHIKPHPMQLHEKYGETYIIENYYISDLGTQLISLLYERTQ